MNKITLISPEQARKIVANSEVRKAQIINEINREITAQSQMGLTWASLPSGLSAPELNWLKDELAINDYTVDANQCKW